MTTGPQLTVTLLQVFVKTSANSDRNYNGVREETRAHEARRDLRDSSDHRRHYRGPLAVPCPPPLLPSPSPPLPDQLLILVQRPNELRSDLLNIKTYFQTCNSNLSECTNVAEVLVSVRVYARCCVARGPVCCGQKLTAALTVARGSEDACRTYAEVAFRSGA
ncbi:hypothetical protein CBL_01992 [Carabus blaptoides fortunei]